MSTQQIVENEATGVPFILSLIFAKNIIAC